MMNRVRPLFQLSRTLRQRPFVVHPLVRPFSATQWAAAADKPTAPAANAPELEVGELEGGSFKIQPLRRTGEDVSTMRARLQYQCRKRGILETDLLLSTFADEHLGRLDYETLTQFDLFLDENDWDIYYWATQEPPSTSLETAEGAASAVPEAPKTPEPPQSAADTSGEWAQTVGKFKPAYRPVPSRWKDSIILTMLRDHVVQRAAAAPKADQVEATAALKADHRGGGLGRMPHVKTY